MPVGDADCDRLRGCVLGVDRGVIGDAGTAQLCVHGRLHLPIDHGSLRAEKRCVRDRDMLAKGVPDIERGQQQQGEYRQSQGQLHKALPASTPPASPDWGGLLTLPTLVHVF
jgi:hypothetical protein